MDSTPANVIAAVATSAAVTGQPGSIYPAASLTEAFDALSHGLVAVDLAAAHISEQCPHGRDLWRLDREQILGQHGEIGELAGLDRAFDVGFAGELGVIDGDHAQQILARHHGFVRSAHAVRDPSAGTAAIVREKPIALPHRP